MHRGISVRVEDMPSADQHETEMPDAGTYFL